LAGVVSGFADVLAYFRFDDLLASPNVNNRREPLAERREVSLWHNRAALATGQPVRLLV
jgi:hypothetical protein